MRALTAVATCTAVLLGALGGCGGIGSGVDRDEYVKANEAIFDRLPHFPASEVIEEVSTPYGENESGPVTGYGTRFVLTLPADSDAGDVAAFFEERLRLKWRLVERLDGPVLNYRHGGAAVSINLENSRVHQMEVAVDSAFYKNRQP